MKDEKYHTAAHLFINAAINFHNALCQKFLNKIPSHKQHSDTSYFHELHADLKEDYSKYLEAYVFLVGYKNQADYGVEISENKAKQIQRKATTIKNIAERLI